MRVREQRTVLLAFSARDMDLRHLCVLLAIKIFIQQLKILAINHVIHFTLLNTICRPFREDFLQICKII